MTVLNLKFLWVTATILVTMAPYGLMAAPGFNPLKSCNALFGRVTQKVEVETTYYVPNGKTQKDALEVLHQIVTLSRRLGFDFINKSSTDQHFIDPKERIELPNTKIERHMVGDRPVWVTRQQEVKTDIKVEFDPKYVGDTHWEVGSRDFYSPNGKKTGQALILKTQVPFEGLDQFVAKYNVAMTTHNQQISVMGLKNPADLEKIKNPKGAKGFVDRRALPLFYQGERIGSLAVDLFFYVKKNEITGATKSTPKALSFDIEVKKEVLDNIDGPNEILPKSVLDMWLVELGSSVHAEVDNRSKPEMSGAQDIAN